MSDSLFQQLSTVAGSPQVKPQTIASATTIAPETFLAFISGTIAVQTITPFVTGWHLLCLIWTSATPGTTLTTGNILNAITPTQDCPTFLVYNPLTGKYSGGTTNLT